MGNLGVRSRSAILAAATLAFALCLLSAPAAVAAPRGIGVPHGERTSVLVPVARRSCGLKLEGVGPDARCSRYRDACLRYGNPQERCNERLEACVRCGVDYQECEKRATGIARFLTSCEKCIAAFKRCTREYDKRLPAKQP